MRLIGRWPLVLGGIALCGSGCQSYSARHAVENRVQTLPSGGIDSSAGRAALSTSSAHHDPAVIPAVFQTDVEIKPSERSAKKPTSESAPRRRLEIPSDIPGSEAAPLRLPPVDPNESDNARRQRVEKLYEPLPNVPERLRAGSTPELASLSLPELQALAFEHTPILRRAAADVEAARGLMIQAGLPPNPTVGYEADTVRTLGTRGYQGMLLSQTFITGGKLTLAQNIAAMKYHNACLALQAARLEVATQVRATYYDTLVAREKVKLTRALAKFTDDIYRAQVDLTTGGQAAPFEPLQLRVLAMQARNTVVQAETEQQGAWRRLAAALGQPNMVAITLIGTVDDSLPELSFDSLQAHLLANHTKLRSVQNDVVQARIQSELECIKPRSPDLTIYGAVQKDYTGPPFNTTYNLQVSLPLPIWDRNQGNIVAAQAGIIRGENDHDAVANSLLQQLADATARYESSRTQAANYRAGLLPDQVRTYRGIYQRYQEDREAVNFGDIVVAQQTLAALITAYIDILGQQWRATVDLAGVLQLDDIEQLRSFAEPQPTPPAPDAPNAEKP